jgi:alkanesulfonate monooxygenase SsuD/methylene tetrahydromethanopterin reductase-like flavin-dependent oxidoreductase (luciferase family)
VDRPLIELSLPLGYGLGPHQLMGLAVEADVSGLDGVVCGELASTEAFALLGAIAQATTRVRIETSVVSILSRSPSLLAMGAVTLADLSGGRFVLGIGVGSPLVAGYHGKEFREPLAGMERTLTAVRAALSGERLPLWGNFQLRGIEAVRVPLLVSAMGDRMIRLAGRTADGVVLSFADPKEVDRMAALALDERARAGADAPFEVHTTVWIDSGDEERARQRFAVEMAPYLAVPTYRQAAIALSDEDAVERVAAAWRSGGRAAAARVFPEQITDALLITGPAAKVAAAVQDFGAAGCRGIRFTPLTHDDDLVGAAKATVQLLGEVAAG